MHIEIALSVGCFRRCRSGPASWDAGNPRRGVSGRSYAPISESWAAGLVARRSYLVGLKGYVTNITSSVLPATEIIASYHDLWHVEQSFRMSKSDLAARPIFHRTREAIEAHLTIVFTALAIARDLQALSGWSLKKIIRALRPLQQITIHLAGQQLNAEPAIPDDVAQLLNKLGPGH